MNAKMKTVVLIMGVIMVMGISGCRQTKYNLIFDGYGFETEKTQYKPGESVTVYYDMIATDTDYSFGTDSDDVVLKQEYDNSHGYVFTFVMPEHDVKLSVSSRNSMEYIPDSEGLVTGGEDDSFDAPKEGEWVCPECNYRHNTGSYCANCGRKKDS